MSEIRPQVWPDNGDRRPDAAEPASTPLLVDEQPHSNFTDDPMTLLWQDADDRDTGHEAVETIRARRKALSQTSDDAPRRRGRGGT